MTYRKIVLSVNLILLLSFYSCRNTSYSELSTLLAGKQELLVALDVDLPGYFTAGDRDYGFQYELLEAYARDLGMELKLTAGNTRNACRQMMLRGGADMVIGLESNIGGNSSTIDLYRTSYVVVTTRQNAVEYNPSTSFLEKFSRSGKLVICPGFRNSETYDKLLDSLPGTEIIISNGDGLADFKSLSRGDYDYIISEKSQARVASSLLGNLRIVEEFAERFQVKVAVNPGVRGLEEDFYGWLADFRETSEYALLTFSYFDSGIIPGSEKNLAVYGGGDKRISVYDHVIRSVAEREGLDWRFLSAIAYNESRFQADIVSHKGAVGLMQIMPVVARQFKVTPEQVINPETNVMLAAKLLKKIESTLRIPAGTPYRDRMSIILACYNGGIGHITDARRLAVKYGFNPNSWEDVSLFLQKKSLPEYNTDEVVKCGVFNGSAQTLAFVSNVIGKYNSYCAITN